MTSATLLPTNRCRWYNGRRFRDFTLRLSGRTDDAISGGGVRAELRRQAAAAGIALGDYVRVFSDGSGNTWDAWPGGASRDIPAGTFT